MTLVDTCVLLDVVQTGSPWADWSQTRLEHAATHGGLLINPVVFSEFSVSYETLENAEAVLAKFGTRFENLPRAALFLAGKAYRQYRKRRGTRTGVLPDFFIGAHAAVRELPLLTHDPKRYRSYFPTVALLTPETT